MKNYKLEFYNILCPSVVPNGSSAPGYPNYRHSEHRVPSMAKMLNFFTHLWQFGVVEAVIQSTLPLPSLFGRLSILVMFNPEIDLCSTTERTSKPYSIASSQSSLQKSAHIFTWIIDFLFVTGCVISLLKPKTRTCKTQGNSRQNEVIRPSQKCKSRWKCELNTVLVKHTEKGINFPISMKKSSRTQYKI